jgi:transcription elongation factor Elf1
MGRKRKKIVKLQRRILPKIFLCPKCGEETVKVTIGKEPNATITCGKCELNAEISFYPYEKPVDIYCNFIDKYYRGELV